MVEEPFILEVKTKEEANVVDLTKYRLEKFSESRDCYIFVRRRGK